MASSMKYLLFAISSILCTAQVHSSIDYYWRDFDGTIPDDAISAGLDRNNKSLYVGQALGTQGYLWAISPITLVPGQLNYTIAINSAYYPNTANKTFALKVLCSPNKENFKWVSTTDEKFPSVENVVQGGWAHEFDEFYNITDTVLPLYIGRSLRFGYPAVGRIQTQTDYFKNNVRYVHEGTQYYSPNYDVLVYSNTN